MILGFVGFCVCEVLSVQSLLWVGRSYLCSLAASHLALGASLPCGEDGDGPACPIPIPLFSVQGTICPLPFILPSHSGPLLPTVNSLSPLLAHLLGNLASTLIPSLSGTFRHSLPATSSSGISLQVLPCPPFSLCCSQRCLSLPSRSSCHPSACPGGLSGPFCMASLWR